MTHILETLNAAQMRRDRRSARMQRIAQSGWWMAPSVILGIAVWCLIGWLAFQIPDAIDAAKQFNNAVKGW